MFFGSRFVFWWLTQGDAAFHPPGTADDDTYVLTWRGQPVTWRGQNVTWLEP